MNWEMTPASSLTLQAPNPDTQLSSHLESHFENPAFEGLVGLPRGILGVFMFSGSWS